MRVCACVRVCGPLVLGGQLLNGKVGRCVCVPRELAAAAAVGWGSQLAPHTSMSLRVHGSLCTAPPCGKASNDDVPFWPAAGRVRKGVCTCTFQVTCVFLLPAPRTTNTLLSQAAPATMFPAHCFCLTTALRGRLLPRCIPAKAALARRHERRRTILCAAVCFHLASAGLPARAGLPAHVDPSAIITYPSKLCPQLRFKSVWGATHCLLSSRRVGQGWGAPLE